MVNYQWNIFWTDLNPVKGSEQSGKRPVVVISSEDINSVLPIVTIISLTSAKPNRQVYPTEVYLLKKDTGLPKDSIVMAHQIRSVSKKRLGEKCGSLSNERLREMVRKAVRLYLDLV